MSGIFITFYNEGADTETIEYVGGSSFSFLDGTSGTTFTLAQGQKRVFINQGGNVMELVDTGASIPAPDANGQMLF